MVRIVPEAEIEGTLTIDEAIDAIERLHRRFADGEAMTDPMETILTPVSDPPEDTTPPVFHGLRTMDGAILGEDVASVRISSDIIHWPHKDGERVREKLPVTNGQYNGFVVLFDTTTGEPLGFFPDAIIQHLRVGASSALAARHMANDDASTLGMLGAGWQARSHAPALDRVLDLDELRVYAPTPASRETFVEEIDDEIDADAVAVDEAEAVFRGADVVQCVTNSTAPVFDVDWIEDGTHVTIIRIPEAPDAFFDLDRLDAFATNWPPNVERYEMYGNRLDKRELGAWTWNHYAIQPDDPVPKLELFGEDGGTADGDVDGDTGLLDWDAVPSLAEIMDGEAAGRTSPDDVTGFFTCAVGTDFTAVSKVLHEAAEREDLGTELPLGLLSQDHHP